MPKISPTQSIGNHAEEHALQFLQNKGLKLLQRQYRTPLGEIDLIMRDKTELVFVEVRYRENHFFGTPEETITQAKQRRLIRAVLCFHQRFPWSEAMIQRFDVVAISGKQLDYKITWIPNAFGVE